MFASVERRLAILTITVVIAMVALTGITTWMLLRQSLEHEADDLLGDRIESVRESLGEHPELSANSPTPNPDDEGDDDDEDEGHELLESGDVLVLVIDAAGRVVDNPRDLTTPSLPVADGVQSALAGDDDTRILEIEGERVRVRTEPLENDDRVIGAIQVLRSERQHDEELRLVGLVSLAGVALCVIVALPVGIWLTHRAMRPVELAFDRQRAFVADASHELRTPLSILRANTELLLRSPEMPASQAVVELRTILEEVDDMTELVNNLLDLSRIEANQQVAIGPVALAPVIEREVAAMQATAGEAGITLHANPVEAAVIGEAGLIGRILRILLENAIMFTPPGGSIAVEVAPAGDHVALTVRDTGPGIAKADRPFIFDRFFRADAARDRTGGAGLGLAIAQALARAMDSKLSLEPDSGTGTAITILLRRAD